MSVFPASSQMVCQKCPVVFAMLETHSPLRTTWSPVPIGAASGVFDCGACVSPALDESVVESPRSPASDVGASSDFDKTFVVDPAVGVAVPPSAAGFEPCNAEFNRFEKSSI